MKHKRKLKGSVKNPIIDYKKSFLISGRNIQTIVPNKAIVKFKTKPKEQDIYVILGIYEKKNKYTYRIEYVSPETKKRLNKGDIHIETKKYKKLKIEDYQEEEITAEKRGNIFSKIRIWLVCVYWPYSTKESPKILIFKPIARRRSGIMSLDDMLSSINYYKKIERIKTTLRAAVKWEIAENEATFSVYDIDTRRLFIRKTFKPLELSPF